MKRLISFILALAATFFIPTAALALLDNTPPVITPTVTGTLGNNGWYTSNVSVSWATSDPESSISNKTGCGNVTINSDTPGQTITCTATSAGGTSSNSVTIKRDATKPTITAAQNPLPNSFGWNNTDVTIHFTCTDSTSGPAIGSPTSDIVKTAEGAGQGYTGTCTDNAGNTKSVNGSVNIDKTNPGIVGSRNTLPNGNGWNNTNVSTHYACTDSLSGPVDNSFNVVISTEGAGQSTNGTCTDKAGNTASTSVTGINIDKTNPTISGNRTPAANSFGWNNTNVTAHFNCGDALSGVATTPNPFNIVVSTEGAGQTATGTCTDLAGNTKSKTITDINIDKTAPVITLNTPADNSEYVRFDDILADWSADGGISGLDTSSGTVPSGSLIDTTIAGTIPFSITATDKAGNTASSNTSYIVDPYPSQCADLAPFSKTIIGTNGDDNLKGSAGNDLIFARDGNDTVDGGAGSDCIVGGEGNDTLSGGTGDDVILGGNGDDNLSGSSGNDSLFGGSGINNLNGGSGMDSCVDGTKISCEL